MILSKETGNKKGRRKLVSMDDGSLFSPLLSLLFNALNVLWELIENDSLLYCANVQESSKYGLRGVFIVPLVPHKS